eukprot:123415_1
MIISEMCCVVYIFQASARIVFKHAGCHCVVYIFQASARIASKLSIYYTKHCHLQYIYRSRSNRYGQVRLFPTQTRDCLYIHIDVHRHLRFQSIEQIETIQVIQHKHLGFNLEQIQRMYLGFKIDGIVHNIQANSSFIVHSTPRLNVPNHHSDYCH